MAESAHHTALFPRAHYTTVSKSVCHRHTITHKEEVPMTHKEESMEEESLGL